MMSDGNSSQAVVEQFSLSAGRLGIAGIAVVKINLQWPLAGNIALSKGLNAMPRLRRNSSCVAAESVKSRDSSSSSSIVAVC